MEGISLARAGSKLIGTNPSHPTTIQHPPGPMVRFAPIADIPNLPPRGHITAVRRSVPMTDKERHEFLVRANEAQELAARATDEGIKESWRRI